MNHRQKLLRVLGSMGTRDYKSPEEMLSGKQFYDMLVANEPKEDSKQRRKRKTNDTIRQDESARPEAESTPADENRIGGSEVLPGKPKRGPGKREVSQPGENTGEVALKT